jgi:threonyl-tRNA synthetase
MSDSTDEHLHAMRHSAAHVLAAAIQKLYPTAQFGVGPVIENGFYYDVLFEAPISDTDLKAIEKQMKKFWGQNLMMEREEMAIDAAVAMFEASGQTFKVELLKDLKEKGNDFTQGRGACRGDGRGCEHRERVQNRGVCRFMPRATCC